MLSAVSHNRRRGHAPHNKQYIFDIQSSLRKALIFGRSWNVLTNIKFATILCLPFFTDMISNNVIAGPGANTNTFTAWWLYQPQYGMGKCAYVIIPPMGDGEVTHCKRWFYSWIYPAHWPGLRSATWHSVILQDIAYVHVIEKQSCCDFCIECPMSRNLERGRTFVGRLLVLGCVNNNERGPYMESSMPLAMVSSRNV